MHVDRCPRGLRLGSQAVRTANGTLPPHHVWYQDSPRDRQTAVPAETRRGGAIRMAAVLSSHRTAVARGLTIAYDDVGRGAPAVVLIHGAFGNRSHFAAQVEHLAQR